MTGTKKSKRLSVLLCLIMMISVLLSGQAAYAADGYSTLTIKKEVAGNAAEKGSKYKFTITFAKKELISWKEARMLGYAPEDDRITHPEWETDQHRYIWDSAGEWSVHSRDG